MLGESPGTWSQLESRKLLHWEQILFSHVNHRIQCEVYLRVFMLVTYLLWIHFLLYRVTHTQLLEITSSNLPPKYVKSMKLAGLSHSWFVWKTQNWLKIGRRQEERRRKGRKEQEEEGREGGRGENKFQSDREKTHAAASMFLWIPRGHFSAKTAIHDCVS